MVAVIADQVLQREVVLEPPEGLWHDVLDLREAVLGFVLLAIDTTGASADPADPASALLPAPVSFRLFQEWEQESLKISEH